MFIDTGVMNKFHNAHSYFTLNEKFQNYHKSNFKNLKVIPSKPMFSQPSTIIMIIGESASRDFMSAYTNTSNDTTPWMRTMSLQSNCILFKNAYSSWIQTVPALERALTEKINTTQLNLTNLLHFSTLQKSRLYDLLVQQSRHNGWCGYPYYNGCQNSGSLRLDRRNIGKY